MDDTHRKKRRGDLTKVVAPSFFIAARMTAAAHNTGKSRGISQKGNMD